MRKILVLILLCSMLFSGCAYNFHITEHCDCFSADRVVDGKEREGYNPYITPVTDVVMECLCYTEDGLISLMGPRAIDKWSGTDSPKE